MGVKMPMMCDIWSVMVWSHMKRKAWCWGDMSDELHVNVIWYGWMWCDAKMMLHDVCMVHVWEWYECDVHVYVTWCDLIEIWCEIDLTRHKCDMYVECLWYAWYRRVMGQYMKMSWLTVVIWVWWEMMWAWYCVMGYESDVTSVPY